MSAAEAARRLGVRAQSLYAYVSRGRIRVRPDPDDPRRHHYAAADIDAWTRRKARGRSPAAVARGVLDWGEPAIDSRITRIEGGRLFYRDLDAAEMSADWTLEAVGRHLRGQQFHSSAVVASAGTAAGPAAPGPESDPKVRAFACLADAAARAWPTLGRGAAALDAECDALLDAFLTAITGRPGPEPAHARLAALWGRGAAGADRIRRALVLIADHELNPSTFAARVAASTGASLAAAALAGLAALSGPRHGEAARRALAYLRDAEADGADAAIAARLATAAPLPGLGHPLYPDGDPRAAELLSVMPPHPAVAAAEAAGGGKANIDMALALLARHENLPESAPFLLFACGRMAGWLAHAREQADSGIVLRPRAVIASSTGMADK